MTPSTPMPPPLPWRVRVPALVMARMRGWPGWLAVGCAAYGLFVLLTFPFDALGERISAEAAKQGVNVRFGAIGPAFFGLRAREVVLSGPPRPDGTPGEPLRLDAVSLRPALFPLGAAFDVKAFGGRIDGSAASPGGGLALHIRFEDLDPSRGNFAGFTGVKLEGLVSGELRLDAPARAQRSPAGGEPDFSAASGHLSLKAERFGVLGGNVTVPMYGQPTPLDLPRLGLGNVDVGIKVDKGEATIERLEAKGGDIELIGEGNIHLRNPLTYSELDTRVALKAEPAAAARLGILASGLTMLPPHRTQKGYRGARVSGMLGRPQFLPAR